MKNLDNNIQVFKDFPLLNVSEFITLNSNLLLLAASVCLPSDSQNLRRTLMEVCCIMAAKMHPQRPFFGFREESEGRRGDLETNLRSTCEPRQLNLIEGPWVLSLKICQWSFYFTPLTHKSRLYSTTFLN